MEYKLQDDGLETVVFSSGDLSHVETKKHEKQVQYDADITSIALLLNQYYNDEEIDKYHRLILELIEKYPETSLIRGVLVRWDYSFSENLYAKAKRIWSTNIERNRNNVNVLINAAEFYSLLNEPFAEQYFLEVLKIEPECLECIERLADFYQTNLVNIEKAIYYYKHALQIAINNKNDEARIRMLTHLCKLSFDAEQFDDAFEYASECTSLDTNVGNLSVDCGDASHDGHHILGKIALKNERIDEAKKHLILSLQVKGGRFLNEIGPHLLLAQLLLDINEKECVIEYLNRSMGFLSSDNAVYGINKNVFGGWINKIKVGDKPKLYNRYDSFDVSWSEIVTERKEIFIKEAYLE